METIMDILFENPPLIGLHVIPILVIFMLAADCFRSGQNGLGAILVWIGGVCNGLTIALFVIVSG